MQRPRANRANFLAARGMGPVHEGVEPPELELPATQVIEHEQGDAATEALDIPVGARQISASCPAEAMFGGRDGSWGRPRELRVRKEDGVAAGTPGESTPTIFSFLRATPSPSGTSGASGADKMAANLSKFNLGQAEEAERAAATTAAVSKPPADEDDLFGMDM